MKQVPVLAIILLLCKVFDNVDGKGGGGSDEPILDVIVSSIGSNEVGTAIKLQCDFKTIDEPEAIYWFEGNDLKYAKQREALFISSKITASTEDFKSTKSHYVIINEATLDDSKTITCQVKPKGAAEKIGTYQLVVNPHNKELKQGQNVTFACSRAKSGLLIWKKDKSVIVFNQTIIGSNARLQLSGRDLKISRIEASDVGTYTCYVGGKRVDATTLSIFVTQVIKLSPLRGYRGYLFGGCLAVLIIGTLLLALHIQRKPFSGAENIITRDRY